MASHIRTNSWFLLISFAIGLCIRASEGDQKTYIVYMGDRPKGEFSTLSPHTSMLKDVMGSRASESLLHSYKRSFHGFVAKMTEEEKDKVASMEGVVSVFPNGKKQLQTVRSWDFMGFPQQVRRVESAESNVVIGMLDTGVWPQSDSFSDEGFGPPPAKWKGSCHASPNFTCNNKIIGAKYYRTDGNFGQEDIISPVDSDGHGSHTASTAAGRPVRNANLFGLASGTARGGVPSARIAVYKVCWSDGCSDADILAAFDDAIADGVDIISISIGGFTAVDYFEDPIAIGAFHAMKNGILTSSAAGNTGPDPETLSNFSPWSLSVAASTIDRKFLSKVKLGNGKGYEGVSLNTFNLDDMYPLVYGGDVPNTRAGFNGSQSRYCTKGTLDRTLVKGKIVLCDWLNSGTAAFHAGAVGTIMQDGGIFRHVAYSFPLPASYLGLSDGSEVFAYINSTHKPRATIERSITSKDQLAPYVVSFSSRGPNPKTRDILKPDIAAPGVDIIAAWSQVATVTGIEGDKRVVSYNVVSGTSMACPHVTAAAAYVKSFHPEWSPAAIMSALMTTASPMKADKNPDAEFAYGSGHLDPLKAINPGLVYDAGEVDYVKFLCGQGYSNKSVRLVTGDKHSNCTERNTGTVWDLNYPSFAVSSKSKSKKYLITRTFHRTVTNMGSPVSTYKAIVVPPPGLKMVVVPSVLSFVFLGEKQSFMVKVGGVMRKEVLSGSLVWEDGVHRVRSPIVAHVSS